MSRFPLFPLLLSLSTTLQSACLQDKCSVQPFKDNDAECMPDMTIIPDFSVLPDGSNSPGMIAAVSFGKVSTYSYELRSGPSKSVDSIGMLDIRTTNDAVEIVGQIGAILADRKNKKIDVVVATIPNKLSGGPPMFDQQYPFDFDSVNTGSSQIESAMFSRMGMRFFAKSKNADTADLYLLPWLQSAKQPVSISSRTPMISHFSFGSDDNNRINAVITYSENSANLHVSRSSEFYFANLIEKNSDSGKFRVLVGSFDKDREPELITWDVNGMNPQLFKYNGSVFLPLIGKNVPNIEASGGMINPVALGDLNQDGISDLIVANKSNLKIYYGTGNIAEPFLMPTPDIPARQDVQAIAVSIPSGDDPPKLVWATSTFTPDTMNSATGTNKITINVLPITK